MSLLLVLLTICLNEKTECKTTAVFVQSIHNFEFGTLLLGMINKILTNYSSEETSKSNQNSLGLLNNK